MKLQIHACPSLYMYTAHFYDCKCSAVLYSKEPCFCEGWLQHVLPVSMNECLKMIDSFACAHKFELFLLKMVVSDWCQLLALHDDTFDDISGD